MATTDTGTWEAVLKQGWTQEQTELQFAKDDKFLEELERKQPEEGELGVYGITPVQTGFGGGVTMVGKTGSKELNEADGASVASAKWEYGRIWNAIELDTKVISVSASKEKAVAAAADENMKANLKGMQRQVSRQLFLDQTGFICQCAATTKGNKVKLLTTGEYGLGAEATRQQWLAKGQVIDIGTKAEPQVLAKGVKITAVVDSETGPEITVSGAEIKAEETHFISIAQTRAAEVSLDISGLRNIVSKTTTLGGIKPETEPTWVAAYVNTEGGGISRQRVLECRMAVSQRETEVDWAVTSYKQLLNLESESYNSVRFAGTDQQNLGNGEKAMIGDLPITPHANCPNGDFTLLKKEHIFLLRDKAPYWASEEYGGKMLQLKQGTTFVRGDMEYMLQLGTNRRSGFGGLRGLE